MTMYGVEPDSELEKVFKAKNQYIARGLYDTLRDRVGVLYFATTGEPLGGLNEAHIIRGFAGPASDPTRIFKARFHLPTTLANRNKAFENFGALFNEGQKNGTIGPDVKWKKSVILDPELKFRRDDNCEVDVMCPSLETLARSIFDGLINPLLKEINKTQDADYAMADYDAIIEEDNRPSKRFVEFVENKGLMLDPAKNMDSPSGGAGK